MRNVNLLLILAVILAQAGLYGCGKSEEQVAAERKVQEQKAGEEQVGAAIKMVKEQLKDPGSADFKNVRLLRDKPLLVCGEVNFKNPDGGPAGFIPFVVFRIQEDGVKEMYMNKGASDPAAPVNAGVFLLKRCQ